jgi:hypothetical protein
MNLAQLQEESVLGVKSYRDHLLLEFSFRKEPNQVSEPVLKIFAARLVWKVEIDIDGD